MDGISEVQAVRDAINKYPELKNTTATFNGICMLEVDPTVQPVVHPSRCQPLVLAEKIKAKLKETEEKGQVTKYLSTD